MDLKKKKLIRQKRIWRIRKKIKGTKARPRLCLHLSNKHIYVQMVDDEAGRTLLSLSTLSKELRDEPLKSNVAGAAGLGRRFGEKASGAGFEAVVFDRNGRPYRGVVKAFAEAGREAGLKF